MLWAWKWKIRKKKTNARWVQAGKQPRTSGSALRFPLRLLHNDRYRDHGGAFCGRKKELDMKKPPFYCTKRLKKAYKITQTYTNTHTHRKDDRTDDATEARNRGSKLLLSPIMGNIYENLFIDFLLYCQSLSGCPTFYIHTHTHPYQLQRPISHESDEWDAFRKRGMPH